MSRHRRYTYEPPPGQVRVKRVVAAQLAEIWNEYGDMMLFECVICTLALVLNTKLSGIIRKVDGL